MPSYYTYDSSNLRERNKYTSTVDSKAYGIKRYFSSIDTAVYFGADAVEEIVAIDFTIQEPKLPIYGFNSFFANRMIAGRKTITGTFAINFTKTNYLLEILSKIDDSILANEYDIIVNRCPGNNPLFEKEFDITIGYGYSKIDDPSYGASMQSLLGVRIVEYRQALDTEGNPILDMYSFIAKDLEIGDKEVNRLYIDETPAVMRMGGSGSGPGKETPEEEVNYIIANHYVAQERNELVSKCMNNLDLWGIELTPSLFKEGSMYYAKLSVDHTNKPEKATVEDLSVTFIDHDLSINMSCSMTFNKQYTFTGSYRDQIKKLFNSDDANLINATVSYTIIYNDKKHPITYDTFFFIEEVI